MMSRSLTRQKTSSQESEDELMDIDDDKYVNIFDVIGRNRNKIIAIIILVIAATYAIMLLSLPEKGRVFEGRITRIEVGKIIVHVRSKTAVGDFNATYGMCYGDDVGYICRVGDRVEISQYTSWFDDVYIISAIVE